MKLLAVIILLTLCCNGIFGQIDAYEDNDFAEFEDFDTDDDYVVSNDQWTAANQKRAASSNDEKSKETVENQEGANIKNSDFVEITNDIDDDNDAIVEDDDDNEFEHFQDEEEFEGFDVSDSKENVGGTTNEKIGEPKLTMAKVPIHFRTHWDSYSMEMLMLAGLTIYFANFFLGKNKNSKLANLWLNTHRSLLEENFILVGE